MKRVKKNVEDIEEKIKFPSTFFSSLLVVITSLIVSVFELSSFQKFFLVLRQIFFMIYFFSYIKMLSHLVHSFLNWCFKTSSKISKKNAFFSEKSSASKVFSFVWKFNRCYSYKIKIKHIKLKFKISSMSKINSDFEE